MALITMKTGEMRGMFESLNMLLIDGEGKTIRWPVKVAYWISRITTKLRNEYDSSEKYRLQVAQELGTLSEDGKQYVFNDEQTAEFNRRITEMVETDIEVDLPVINLKEFDGCVVDPSVFTIYDKLIMEV